MAESRLVRGKMVAWSLFVCWLVAFQLVELDRRYKVQFPGVMTCTLTFVGNVCKITALLAYKRSWSIPYFGQSDWDFEFERPEGQIVVLWLDARHLNWWIALIWICTCPSWKSYTVYRRIRADVILRISTEQLVLWEFSCIVVTDREIISSWCTRFVYSCVALYTSR